VWRPVVDGVVLDMLHTVFADEDGAVLDLYARELAGAPRLDVLRAAMTDERYAAPTLRLLDAQSAYGETWRYLVDEVDPGQHGSALHGADVPLVWDVGLDRRDPRTRELGDAMRATWTSFMHGAPPTATGLPAWPQYRAAQPATMVFGFPSRIDTGLTAVEQAWRGREWTAGTWWPEPADDVVRGTSR
jgi:carboxylesterase type B